MGAYKIIIQLKVNSNISRTLMIPGGISFKKLHEIICIVFNLDNLNKYRFIFDDIGLIIQDTGSLNRDHIDSRFEIIDDYLQRYSEIKYSNSFSDMLIKVDFINSFIEYPEIIDIEGKYNPSSNINSVEDYLEVLDGGFADENGYLIKVNLHEIQELLLLLFNIPYTIENNKIILLKQEETLENYF